MTCRLNTLVKIISSNRKEIKIHQNTILTLLYLVKMDYIYIKITEIVCFAFLITDLLNVHGITFRSIESSLSWSQSLSVNDTSFVFQCIGSPTIYNCAQCVVEFKNAAGIKSLTFGIDNNMGTISRMYLYDADGYIQDYIRTNQGEFNVECEIYKPFWVSWKDGMIRGGSGTIPGQGTFTFIN